jgi:hypothetical protein
MKVRIKEDSLRFRLTRSEVDHLAREATIEQETRFGPDEDQSFVCALQMNSKISQIKAALANRRITVFIPKELARNWASTEQVGLEAQQEIGNGKSLRILVEKDFACLERRDGEDESDAFPHPASAKECA